MMFLFWWYVLMRLTIYIDYPYIIALISNALLACCGYKVYSVTLDTNV